MTLLTETSRLFSYRLFLKLRNVENTVFTLTGHKLFLVTQILFKIVFILRCLTSESLLVLLCVATHLDDSSLCYTGFILLLF